MSGNAVVPREPLVDERVVRRQQFDDAPVVAQLAVEEELGFLPKRVAQVLVELGKEIRIGLDVPQIAELEPLAAKLSTSARDRAVAQHPPHLPLEDRRVLQLAAHRHVEQFVVRNAAPEEERQTRRELDIGDAIRRACREMCRIDLDAEEEVGSDQHALERRLDRLIERPGPSARPVELDQRLHVVVGHRTPIGAACQRRKDSLRARLLAGDRSRPAHEDPAAARRVARTGGCNGPFDRDGLDARRAIEHFVGLERPAGARRLQHILGLPELLHERHAEGVRAGLRGNAQFQSLVGLMRVLLPLRIPRERSRKAGGRRHHVDTADGELSDALAGRAVLRAREARPGRGRRCRESSGAGS